MSNFPPTIEHRDIRLDLVPSDLYLQYPADSAVAVTSGVLADLGLVAVGPPRQDNETRASTIYTVNDEYDNRRWVSRIPGSRRTIEQIREGLLALTGGPAWVSPVYTRRDLDPDATGFSFTNEIVVRLRSTMGKFEVNRWIDRQRQHWTAAPYAMDDYRSPDDFHLVILRAKPGGIFLPPGSHSDFDLLDRWADIRADEDHVVEAIPHWIQLHSAAMTTPNDPLYGDQWNLQAATSFAGSANVAHAWNGEGATEDVVVAVIDSGCDLAHEDLKGSFLTPQHPAPSNPSKTVDHVNLSGNNNIVLDDYGHGTKICGVIAAQTDNATGIAGMCKPCKLLIIRLNVTGLSDHDFMMAIKFARLQNLRLANQNVRVVNLSLVLDGQDILTSSEVTNSVAHDVLLVAAAGNGGPAGSKTVRFPARHPDAIAVAAVDRDGNRWDDTSKGGGASCKGTALDVAAPGVGVWTTAVSETHRAYMTANGTSMAAPHVSALAALICAKHRVSHGTWPSAGEVRDLICNPELNRNPLSRAEAEIGTGIIDTEAILNKV